MINAFELHEIMKQKTLSFIDEYCQKGLKYNIFEMRQRYINV